MNKSGSVAFCLQTCTKGFVYKVNKVNAAENQQKQYINSERNNNFEINIDCQFHVLQKGQVGLGG